MEAKAYSYIRFSSPKQETGDSERRQIELSEKYAKEHGLILDDQLTDRGLSAYSGAHRTKGHLGAFLQLVEQGEIIKGSILIVENLDRLSREDVMDALAQFTSIINADITIITLHDGMEYNRESVKKNWTQLIISITYMARAHDESETKSKRLKAAWITKREETIKDKSKKLTRRIPAWIDPETFLVIPERGKAVEIIYQKKLAGKGKEKITTELNDSDIWQPPKSKRNERGGWRSSYVQKILSTKAVIGEFQSSKLEKPIKDYYPKAIDEDLFYQVQELKRERMELRGYSGGKTGKANNLFTHIIKCGLCGGPMHYIDKGKPPKGGQYLHCDYTRRLLKDDKGNRICNAKEIQYKEFEELFFKEFEELDIDSIIPGEDEITAKIHELEKHKKSCSYRKKMNQEEIENLKSAIKRTSDNRVSTSLDKELIQAFDNKEKLQEEYKNYEQDHRKLTGKRIDLRHSIDRAKEVYGLLLSAKTEQERIDIRLRLRIEIKKLIEWIRVYPLQEKYAKEKDLGEGIRKYMRSKFIERIHYKFRSGKQHGVIALTSTIDTSDI